MNKMQRFLAAVRGEPVDHPPSVAWCNFVTDAVDGKENARRQLAFFEACDWDVFKVMNDYRLAPPAGLETIETPADMLRFAKQSMSERIFAEQELQTVGLPIRIRVRIGQGICAAAGEVRRLPLRESPPSRQVERDPVGDELFGCEVALVAAELRHPRDARAGETLEDH